MTSGRFHKGSGRSSSSKKNSHSASTRRKQSRATSIDKNVNKKTNLVELFEIRLGYVICLMNPPKNFYTTLSGQLSHGNRLRLGLPRQPTTAVVIYWPERMEGLKEALDWLRTRITDDGSIWVAIKKRDRLNGDSNEVIKKIRSLVNQLGLVCDKQVDLSVDETAVRLVTRRRVR